MMSELEKMKAGLEYCYDDEEIAAIKDNAIMQAERYNNIDPMDKQRQYDTLKEILGSIGDNVWIGKRFSFDNGKNIHIGSNFTGNYNLTILDIREVYIGDNVMIGPNTLITTVGHPITPKGRREHVGMAEPVYIGDDVWLGGNVSILPGVRIGNNVVVGAGAVVTKDIPDNSLALGVPAKVVREIENDIEED
ncbi:MAG: sugar O-acetyltransferase [Methanobrevibacter sp.]|nr:sugar O-acetyltransferase [Methanobrevibacter sp.]